MKTIVLFLSTEPIYGGEHQYAMLAAECMLKYKGKKYCLYAVCTNLFWKNWCRDHKLEYLYYRYPHYAEQDIRIQIQHPFLSGLYSTYCTEMGKWLKEKNADMLFCLQQGIFLPNYRVKQVRPVHDIMHRYEGRFPEIRCDYEERETIFTSVAKYTDLIFVDSQLGKKQFQECYSNREKHHLNIVVLPFIVPQHIYKMKEQYVQTPEKYIFYPAQLWEHKNHMALLKALHLLRNEIPDIHLVLAGAEKNMAKKIKDYVKENGLEKNVTMLGFVSDEQVTYLYRHAVALVMPTYFGPTNIPPLEAMALGCPVAVSDKYAMPEQVGDAGLKFSPDSPKEIADCIRRLWTDKNLRRKLINAGYEQVGNWTKKDFEKKLVKSIYQCLYRKR